MTTIACNGMSMAGDGFVTNGDVVFSRSFAKVRRLSDGRIAGVSGSAFHVAPFLEWLEDGGEKPKIDVENFEALVLHVDGTCLCYDADCRSIPEELPTASGSGKAFALGAMDAGATPEEAVEIACDRDCSSGGTVIVLHLESKLKEVA